MKNALLLLLFIVGLASCTIEKRRYFKGYHVALRQAQGPGKRESGEEGKRVSAQEQQSVAQLSAASDTSNNEKPQRGEIVIAGEIEIPGDTEIADDVVLTSSEANTRGNVPLPVQCTGQVVGRKKSQALEGIGAIFLLGIITLVVIVALLIFILTDSAVLAVIGSLIIGLFLAIGVYLLLMILFFVLLFLIINSFGS